MSFTVAVWFTKKKIEWERESTATKRHYKKKEMWGRVRDINILFDHSFVLILGILGILDCEEISGTSRVFLCLLYGDVPQYFLTIQDSCQDSKESDQEYLPTFTLISIVRLMIPHIVWVTTLAGLEYSSPDIWPARVETQTVGSVVLQWNRKESGFLFKCLYTFSLKKLITASGNKLRISLPSILSRYFHSCYTSLRRDTVWR